MFHCFFVGLKKHVAVYNPNKPSMPLNKTFMLQPGNEIIRFVWCGNLRQQQKNWEKVFRPHRASTLYLTPMVRPQPGPRAKYLPVVNLRSFNG